MVGFIGLLAVLRHGEVRTFKSQAKVRKFKTKQKFASSMKLASLKSSKFKFNSNPYFQPSLSKI